MDDETNLTRYDFDMMEQSMVKDPRGGWVRHSEASQRLNNAARQAVDMKRAEQAVRDAIESASIGDAPDLAQAVVNLLRMDGWHIVRPASEVD